jgi:TorA maturation chaperone TorD
MQPDPRAAAIGPLAGPAVAEELARAEMYGVLALLLQSPPSPETLQQLADAPTESAADDSIASGAPLVEAWRELVAAARARDPAQVADEYGALFQGVGRPEVLLLGSHYLSGFLNDRPLAALRDDLRDIGLARAEQVFETEDHIAFLCEVMRYLIAGDDAEVANLERQRRFFRAHLQPWAQRLGETIAVHPAAGFYAAVGRLLCTFMQVEAQGFDLLE